MISELQKRKLFQVLDLLAEIGRMHLTDLASQTQNFNELFGKSDAEDSTSEAIVLITED